MKVEVRSDFGDSALLMPHDVVSRGQTHAAVFLWPMHSGPTFLKTEALPMHSRFVEVWRQDRAVSRTRIV